MEIVKKIIALILSVLIILSITINITNTSSDALFNYSISFIQSNSFVWVILVLFLYFIIERVLQIKEKRLIVCSLVLAMLLSFMYIIGNIIDTYLDLSIVLTNSKLILFYLFKWMGTVLLLYTGIASIFTLLNKKTGDKKQVKEWNFFKPTIKNFFIYWVIIFALYIPYFLTYYPGNITSDAFSQITQSIGIGVLSNHHPLFHTFVIGIFANLGGLFENYNIGIALYSIAQMLALSGIFAYTVYYMAKKEVPLSLRVITLIFYALYPVHALYSITMWKDIPFAISMLLFTIFITEIVTNKEKFFESKANLLLFAISILLVLLFRNNGIYVVILTAPFIFVFARKYYKQLIVVFVSVLLIYSALWKGLIFNILKVQEGSIVEALSIPLQQIARVVNEHSDELTEEEMDTINKFWKIDNLGEIYDPRLSDNVKWAIDDKILSDNKGEFIKLWLGLFIKYPITYVESFLCNSYGYWYPEASNWVVARTIYQPENESEQIPGLKQTPIIEGNIIKQIDSYIEKRSVPVLSMIFSIGFAMWLVFGQITYIIYKRQYKFLLLFVPILFLWLTNLASPVFCEYRYIYSLFTCLPMLLFVSFIPTKNGKESV